MVRSLSRPVYAGLLARVPVLISLGMRAHWHGYAGRDRDNGIRRSISVYRPLEV